MWGIKQIKIKVICFVGSIASGEKKETKSEKLGLKIIVFNSTFSERFPNSDSVVDNQNNGT